jgi:CHAT domain-containing protein
VRRVLAHLGTLLVEVGSVADASVYLQRASSRPCPALMALSGAERGAAQTAAARTFSLESAADAADASCRAPIAPANLSADATFAVFHALLALSDIATLEGHTDTAMQCLGLAKAYKRSARTQLRLANAAGFVYVQKGNGTAAQAAFETGIRVAEQANLSATGEHRPLSFLGLAQAALLEQETEKAQRYAIQALTFSSKRADVSQVVAALQILARALRASGDEAAAVRMLLAAANLAEQLPIEELDATTRATYLATQHGVFAELTDLLVARASNTAASDPDATWAAFNESERGHARSFRYALNQTTSDESLTPHPPPAASYTQLVHRIADVAGSDARVTTLNPATRQLIEFAAESERRAAALNPAALTTQLKLARATLVEYAAGRTDMYAFVIEGTSIHVVQLGNLKTIAAAAADLFERLHDPEAAAADIQHAAQRLARLALWPATRFVSRERVIFVPDDSLNTVPFAVLPWAQDPGSGLLVQRAEVSIAPSALFLARHADSTGAPAQAARLEFIGDPVFDIGSWQRDCSHGQAATDQLPVSSIRSASDWAASLPRLPGSRAEILALAQLARAARPKSQIRVHLGCEATPAAVREAAAAGAQLLHIATHGYVDAQRPRLSALALSRDSATSPAAGVFGLPDILDIKLVSRLVVLSGCSTSRGRLLPGEGIVGPAQAFLQSGAASVLASAWRIDDAGIVAFMRSFYEHLLKEHLPAAAALRRAQLDELTAGNAYTWAAFALYGWPDSSF